MKCPRCQSSLGISNTAPDQQTLCCTSCEGIWLGKKAMEVLRRERGIKILDEAGGPWERVAWQESPASCPEDGTRLRMFTFRSVEVDMCPTCLGLWLDRGEWEKITQGGSPGGASAGISAGAAAAAVAGVVLMGGATMIGSNPDPHKNTRIESEGLIGDPISDVVDESVSGVFGWAGDLVGDLFSSALDVF